MAIEFLGSIYDRFVRLGDFLGSGRFASLKLALFSLSVCLFLAFPSRLANRSPETEGWEPIIELIEQPFQNMAERYPHDEHSAKLTFRITMPVLGHYLGLGPVGLCIVQYALGLLQFYLLAALARRFTGEGAATLFFCLAVGSTYPGLACFNYTHPYFDGVALCLLTVAICFRHPAIILPTLFLAAFTDERGFIASSLVLVFHIHQAVREGKPAPRALFCAPALAVYVSWAAYFVARMAMTRAYGLDTSDSGTGLDVLFAQWATLRFGLWAGIDGGWLLVLVALIALWRSNAWLPLLMYAGSILVLMTVAILITDINRGAAYLMPAVLVALAVLSRTEKPAPLRGLLAAAAFVSLACGHYQVHGDKPFWAFYSLPARVVQFLYSAIT
ncbi:MAG: hypothetical protein KDA42_04035 [Planctomycetales bacterium]|nr:hypothetical protein [Planctomycetales bacterium]